MLATFNMPDERAIIGGYKSQCLIDADAIYWHKQILIKTFKFSKFFSWFSNATVLPLLIFIIRGIASIISRYFHAVASQQEDQTKRTSF